MNMADNYFADIEWVSWGHDPACTAQVDHCFKDVYNLQLAWRGRIHYQIDNGPRQILEGPVMFWHHPRHTYHYRPADTDWDHYHVVFRGERARRWVESGWMPLVATGAIPLTEDSEACHLFMQLVQTLHQPAATDHSKTTHALTVAQMEQILATAQAEAARDAPLSPAQERACQIIAHIDRHPERQPDWSTLAERAHLSVGHLRRLIAEQTGESAKQYVLTRRMARARRLLIASSMNIQQVAFACGYPDMYQFSRMFKRKVGLSPSAFRRLNISQHPQPSTPDSHDG